MKTPLKLNHMETGDLLIAGISSLGAISVSGIIAIIRQAKTNTALFQRVKILEERDEDIKEIKDSVVDIRIKLAEDTTIRKDNHESIALVLSSIARIDERIDNLSKMG
jgi:hypothetical protein